MNNYKLTVAEEWKNIENAIPRDKASTVEIVEFGLRASGSQAQWVIARRLEVLREVALQLVEQLVEEGWEIDPINLQLIDVEMEVKSKKRLTL